MQALAVVIISGFVVYPQGKLYLLWPVAAGCVLGIACWLVTSYRILKSARLAASEAKKAMQLGWGIRLLLILATLIAAAHISEEVFWSVTAGFFFMFALVMANVIAYAYKMNASNEK